MDGQEILLQLNLHSKFKYPFDMFNFIIPGYNVRPLELSGAIGIEQLKKLDNLIKTRGKMQNFY